MHTRAIDGHQDRASARWVAAAANRVRRIHRRKFGALLCVACTLICASSPTAAAEPGTLGEFSGHDDVGATSRPGTASYDPARKTYTVGGSGENMWGARDAFQFVWTKVSGDVTLAADIDFVGASAQPHRKACLMVRQSLEPGSVYADAALHGDGLTCLQFRDTNDAATHEVQVRARGPRRLRVEKHGHYVSISVAPADEPLAPAGGAVRLELHDPYFVGLAVCAHDEAGFETATFSAVELETNPPALSAAHVLSTLEILDVASSNRRVICNSDEPIESPNWSPDGTALYFNRGGRIYRLSLDRTEPDLVDTGFAVNCNSDHGASPGGTELAISDATKEHRSLIYIVPIGGGLPRQITPRGPSYWHGWSPDGATLAFCGQRDGNFDVYTIPVDGGEETRLTDSPGIDDGPEFSPDGVWIYFCSDRAGRMQIWRMRRDGSEQEQVTSDEYNNWFPHPSPDGQSLVFLSYGSEIKGHPADQDVMLRLLPLAGGDPVVLARFRGGQGTINAPSWSPDGSRFAFVSRQLLPGD